ncbi:MAG TPA: histidine phosphatase family protein [Rhodoblastus sp.]|nr:histidine phosphatase family protein [Rhodoblastus sp.]
MEIDPTSAGLRQIRFVLPGDATRVVLVRHGESAAVEPGRPQATIDGQGDPDLHPEGLRQAEAVAERLAREDIAAIYVSTLRRTLQTARPLLRRLSMEARIEPRLREVHLGEWEGGVYRMKLAERHPIALQMTREQRWDIIPGVEDPTHFRQRVETAVAVLAGRHAGQTIVVVTHRNVIGHLVAHACGARHNAFNGAENGSISEIVVSPAGSTVRSFNETGHLRDQDAERHLSPTA